MNKKIFVTGISTDVGKTIASSIIVEAFHADYWKPVQAGDLSNSDTDKVKSLISNSVSKFHPNSYTLKTPMSPHAAAEIDEVEIHLNKIIEPDTNNHLVIEGAGGLLVPLNDKHTILDIIQQDYKVVVVSRHYLGSINHTLLTIDLLKEIGHDVSIIFSGSNKNDFKHQSTERIIEKMSKVPIIGRIDEEKEFNKSVIKKYADLFKNNLEKL